MNRRWVWSWALFDLANSVYPGVVTATLFSVFYADFVVGGEGGLGDFLWTLAVAVSALMVATSAPLLGSIADRGGARKKFMLFFTLVCVVGVSLFSTLRAGMVLTGFLLFVMANYSFESALVFYNAYLPDIAPPERQGWVSGLGFGLGYIGSALGLLIAIPLARERIELVWIFISVFFLVFSIPAFTMLPKDERTGVGIGAAAKWGLSSFRTLVGEVWRLKNMRNFLFSFFFYIDGVLSIIVVAGLVAAQTFGFGDEERLLMFLIVQISALVGAFALARPTDTFGPKRVLNGVLVLWIVVGLSGFFVQDPRVFYGLAVVAGLGLGSVQSASRALMSSLIPDGKEAEMFGFYALCGKSSSFVGPLLFGGASLLSGGNQRPGFLLLTGLFVIGFILLQRVQDPRAAKQPVEA